LSEDFDADSVGFDEDDESVDVEVDPLPPLDSLDALDSLAALPLLLPASDVDFLA
jgi:hypothetical protein